MRHLGEVAQLGLSTYRDLSHISGALVLAGGWGISVVLRVGSFSPEVCHHPIVQMEPSYMAAGSQEGEMEGAMSL